MTLRVHPDEALRVVCREVKEDITQLAKEMLATMREHSGVGLAAPQVGSDLRVFVTIDRQYPVFVNPRIVKRSDFKYSNEGCLSLPGIMHPVRRAQKVTIKALDIHLYPFTVEAEGLLAITAQHEIDHLRGRLITDYPFLGPDEIRQIER